MQPPDNLCSEQVILKFAHSASQFVLFIQNDSPETILKYLKPIKIMTCLLTCLSLLVK